MLIEHFPLDFSAASHLMPRFS